jgi:hypothetical protein
MRTNTTSTATGRYSARSSHRCLMMVPAAAVAAHVGGEDLEQCNVPHSVHKPANAGERQRNRNLSAGTEFGCLSHKRDTASLAALYPHIPWTPPPGGVDDEQR